MDMDKVFTDDEAMRVVQALLETRRRNGATEDEIRLVLAWATEARVSYHLLNLTLKGRVQIDVRDGDVIFHANQ